MNFVKRRGGAKTDSKSTDDVENQSKLDAPKTRPASKSSSVPSSTASSNINGGNPITVLLRKIMLLTSSDNATQNYILTIIKDIISGTILGMCFYVCFMTVLCFLALKFDSIMICIHHACSAICMICKCLMC